MEAHLKTLRAGTTLISAEELAKIESEWGKWRGEWVRRKKIFNTYVHALCYHLLFVNVGWRRRSPSQCTPQILGHHLRLDDAARSGGCSGGSWYRARYAGACEAGEKRTLSEEDGASEAQAVEWAEWRGFDAVRDSCFITY